MLNTCNRVSLHWFGWGYCCWGMQQITHMTSSGNLEQLFSSQQWLPESWQPGTPQLAGSISSSSGASLAQVTPVPLQLGDPVPTVWPAPADQPMSPFLPPRRVTCPRPRHWSKAMTPRLHGPLLLANRADLALPVNSWDEQHNSRGGSLG